MYKYIYIKVRDITIKKNMQATFPKENIEQLYYDYIAEKKTGNSYLLSNIASFRLQNNGHLKQYTLDKIALGRLRYLIP